MNLAAKLRYFVEKSAKTAKIVSFFTKKFNFLRKIFAG